MKKVSYFIFCIFCIIFSFNISYWDNLNIYDEDLILQKKWEELLEKYIYKKEGIKINILDKNSLEYDKIIEEWINNIRSEILREWEKILKNKNKLLNNIINEETFDPLSNNQDFNLYLYNKLNNNISLSNTSLLSVNYYDEDKSISYAKKWALWRNPEYYDFLENDCTNFVSQSLQAWLMPFIVDWVFGKYDDNNWYYNYYNPWTDSSHTWINASKFYKHTLKKTSRFSSKSSYSYLSKWDLIFADWENNGIIDHSMIITEKTGSLPSQIKLSYHSNNRLNKPLQDLFNDPNISSAKYYYVKVIY